MANLADDAGFIGSARGHGCLNSRRSARGCWADAYAAAGPRPGARRCGDAGVRQDSPGALAQGRHADAAVAGVRGGPRRGAHLGAHAVLRALPRLRAVAQALDAPSAPRRREAVHRLCRAHDRAARRRARQRVRGGAGRLELHVCLRHAQPEAGRLDRGDGARARVHRGRAATDRARQRPRADHRSATSWSSRAARGRDL